MTKKIAAALIAVFVFVPGMYAAAGDFGSCAYVFDVENEDAVSGLTRQGWHKLSFEGRIEEARADFEEALEQKPDDIWAAYGLSRTYLIRGDFARELDACLNVLKHKPDHPLTELLLWTVESLSSAVKGYGAKTAPVIEQLLADEERLSIEQRAIGYRILKRIYDIRRDRKKYDSVFKKLGYITEWNTLGPVGSFDNINFFDRLEPESDNSLRNRFKYEGEQALKKRFSSVDGWLNPPWFEDGLYYAESYVKASAAVKAVMRVTSAGPIKVFLNGHEMYLKDAVREYVAETELVEVELEKGWNRVLLKFIYHTGTPKVSLQIFVDKKTRLKAETKRHRYPTEKPVGRVIEPELCGFFKELSEKYPEDSFAAGMYGIACGFYRHNELRKSLLYKSVEANPRDAYFNYILGSALRIDQSQPEKVAASKARPFYQKALDLADTYPAALYRLSRYDINENKFTDGIEKLKLAAAQSPDFYLWHRELYNIYRSKGWERESREELDRMMEVLPDAPEAYRIAWDFYSKKGDEKTLERLTEQLSNLSLVSDHRARLEKSRGDFKRARVEYEKLLKERPYSVDYAESLLDVLISLNELSDAGKLLKRMIDIAPEAEKERFREKLAQLYFQLGRDKAGRRELESILDENPVNERVRNGLKLYGLEDVLDRYVIDPFEQIEQAEYQQYAEYGAVMLIDQMVQEIYPDYSNRQKVHQLVWVNSKAAINQWAEVNMPENAEILDLRTIKHDGTISEPEIIESGKKSISMTDVGQGDFIEIKYISWEEPSNVYPDGYLGPKFYFRMPKYPSVYGQYVLIYPDELDIKWENANGIGEPVTGKIDNGRLYALWERNNNDAYLPEPYSAGADHYMQYVQVGCNLSDQTIPRWYRSINMGRTRSTYELHQAYDRITVDGSTPDQKARDIYRFVSTEIEGSGGALLTEEAGMTLAAKRGNRTALMASLLDIAGIDYEIVMTKRFGQKDSAVFPHSYPGSVIKVYSNRDEPEYYDVSQKYFSPGFIAAGVQGMEAISLAKPGEQLYTPRIDPAGNSNSCIARIELDAAGNVNGNITRTFRGSMAAGLRRGFVKAERYQIKNQLQRLLSSYFRAARMGDFDIEGLHDIEKPLVIKYSFEASHYARASQDELVLDQGFYAVNAATSYARVEQRETPMQLNADINNVFRVELKLPDGYDVVEYPDPLSLEGKFGHYAARFELNSGQLVYTKKFRLPLLLIFPDDYNAFKNFCEAIDQFEKKDLIIKQRTPAEQEPEGIEPPTQLHTTTSETE